MKLIICVLLLVMSTLACAADEPIQVVFAGFGRSGTHSLSAALTKLGYNACHGSDIVPNLMGSHEALGDAIMKYDVDEILEETSKLGYNATLECHSPFWEQIMEKRPDAKYVFMIRDYDSWFESIVQLRLSLAPLHRYPLRLIPWANVLYKSSTCLAAYTFGHPGDDDIGRELVMKTRSESSRSYHKRGHF
jgi:hypothetical protein